jgi:predicted transport protein
MSEGQPVSLKILKMMKTMSKSNLGGTGGPSFLMHLRILNHSDKNLYSLITTFGVGMPVFEIKDSKLSKLRSVDFKLEKDLQKLLEENLEEVFNIRFVASEFSTGSVHSGRIDSLGLSEDNNPVIIEYKKVESSQLINQSLFYLSWLSDHHGDFEIAVRNKLGNDIEVDWSNIRVICIAPNFKKYDLHAVNMMGANIELWQYKLYEDKVLHLEEVLQRNKAELAVSGIKAGENGKNPIYVEAGKKAALTRANATYTVEEHIDNKPAHVVEMFEELRKFIVDLDETIDEAPKKNYVAYKTTQNFACVEVHTKNLLVYLKLKFDEVDPVDFARDVTGIGHFGTGDFELRISNQEQLDAAKQYVEMSYQKMGA